MLFTKYIPVEGEIFQGDYYQDPGELKLVLQATESPRFYKGLQKVKLFLCSRDIQVGDAVVHLNGVSKGKYVAASDLEDTCYIDAPLLMGQQCVKSNWYKVIGEVSSNAIWVKEGMEFEEDDIDDDVDGHFVTTIGIKCPTCNTFH